MEKSVLIARLEELQSWLDKRAMSRHRAARKWEFPLWKFRSELKEAAKETRRAATVDAALDLVRRLEAIDNA